MKKLIKILLIALTLATCSKEEAIPITADFELDIFKEDYSIPVQVVVINKTEGADTYEWTFEGAVPGNSSQRNPGFITYNEKGTYTVSLTASNQDGSMETKEVEIQIDAPVVVDFEINTISDTFSPAEFSFDNLSSGATSYQWTFEGGVPATSDQRDPGVVSFTEPGEHQITLEISNGRETYDLQKTIEVAPYLVADFDFEVAFEDDDLEIPVKTQFTSTSVSATSYAWQFEGATPATSTGSNPEVVFIEPGTHTITLTATNGKETKTITKEISVRTNTNVRMLTDIKLGINTAHNQNIIGSFYSLSERKVYTAEELAVDEHAEIDLVFFGLGSDFSRNKFVSPNNLEETTFSKLENGKKTLWINSQELCNCMASLTINQFDGMTDDSLLNPLEITETPGGIQAFDDELRPRIVLFQTQDGRKGAIKIKQFIEAGSNSYIVVDIKVQKEKQ